MTEDKNDVSQGPSEAGRLRQLIAVARRPFYSNSIYLLGKTVVNSGSGFVFWVLAARLFSPADVGLAAALISAAMFLGWLTSLGLDMVIVRYLPEASSDSSGLVNSCLTIWNITSLIGALGCLAILPLWVPALGFIRESPLAIAVFVATVVAGGIGGLVDLATVVLRWPGLLFARSVFQALLRLLLLVALAKLHTEAVGLFASYGLATVISGAVALWLFLPRALPGFRPRLVIGRHITGAVARFSFANYLAGGLQAAPLQILPLLVLNMLGTHASAYSYIGWRTATPLFAVAEAAATSLFAEGSREDEALAFNVARSFKLTALLLLPAVAVVLLGGGKLLLLFGGNYSAQTTILLRVLAIATFPDAIIEIYLSITRVERTLWSLALIPTIVGVVTLGLGYLLIPRLGIVGPALAWLGIQSVIALAILPRLVRMVRSTRDPQLDLAAAGVVESPGKIRV